MLLEAVVLTVCMQNSGGCTEGATAYYKQSETLQGIYANVDYFAKKTAQEQEWIVFIGTPVHAMIAKQPLKFPIYKNTTINVNPWNDSMMLEWSY